MQVEQHKSLQKLNTFGFEQYAEYYVEIHTADDLEAATAYAKARQLSIFILGGGSNLVLTRDIPGLTIRLMNDAVSYQTDNHAGITRVESGAGVVWHQLVLDTTQRDLYGLENLSLIPGTVGAAPVQNIGAYGVELKDHFTQLQALHLPTGEWLTFDKQACEYAYRDSHFKSHPGEYAIFSVEFELSHEPKFNTEYGALSTALSSYDKPLTAKRVSDVVCTIRQSKLPDPACIGNAGSFFKNPVIDAAQHQSLVDKHPDLVSYAQANGSVKLAAGWLIDSLGFRGKTHGGVGVYDKQALVLVNNGDGQSVELIQLATEIKQAVASEYGVALEIEPQVI